MEVLINLPDGMYEQIKDSSTIFRDDERTCYEAVKTGTPLPKGHGELIDKRSLEKSFFTYARFYKTWNLGKSRIEAIIGKEKAIIEADKESKE